MIELKNISYQTDTFKLHSISHLFEENKIHAILGPSGSGKTILLELLAGLLTPTTGKIYYHNKEISTLPPQDRNIAYLPQDNVLFPHLSVIENITFPLQLKGNKNLNDAFRISEQLHIQHLLKRNIQNLSGGEIQRIALARSIVAGRKILLLDEPTASIHYTLKNEFLYFLKDIQKEYQLTILFVTHDIDGAFSIADEINFLIHGIWYETFYNHSTLFIPRRYEVAKFMGIKNIFEGFFSSPQIITCPSLNTTLQIPFSSSSNIPPGKVLFAIKPEDVRIVLPEKRSEYQDIPNKLIGYIKKIHRHYQYYNLFFYLKDTETHLEVYFPITKTSKIELREGAQIEVVLKPENIFILC